MPICTQCHQEKPLEDFYREARAKSGHQSRCKICHNHADQKYYQKHSHVIKQRTKKWREANPVRSRDAIAKWHAEHPERMKIIKRQSYERNIEKVRQSVARSERMRRTRIKATKIARIDFRAIMIRDDMICHICKKTVQLNDLSFDHKIPLSKGGPHIESNISVSHLICNRRKQNKIL